MSPQNIEYEGRHRDESYVGRWIGVLKELNPETVAMHDSRTPRHAAKQVSA